MIIFLYDHSWMGFLSAIFEIYERKPAHCQIIGQGIYQPDAFSKAMQIFTDPEKAVRVSSGLKKKLSSAAMHELYSCFLSGLPGIEDVLLAYIRLVFASEERVEHAYAHPAVLQVSQVARKVHREKHRMEAFVRFRLTADNLYFAEVEPDFNVLPLILPHFRDRYADQRWIIYDLKRNYGIYYDLQEVTEVVWERQPAEQASSGVFNEEEALYETLWKDYFKHINITERKNTRLHLRHVPKRYWKHLAEKSGL